MSVEIIFIHIPKTAGSSFRFALEDLYNLEEICRDYDASDSNLPLTEQSKIISGHFHASKYRERFPNAKEILFLRDPLDRVLSNYFFNRFQDRKTLLSLEEEKKHIHLRLDRGDCGLCNLMANMIGIRELESFFFVGITEFFKEDVSTLSTKLNKSIKILNRNLTKQLMPNYMGYKRAFLEDKEICDKILEKNQLDIKLYNKALRLRKK